METPKEQPWKSFMQAPQAEPYPEHGRDPFESDGSETGAPEQGRSGLVSDSTPNTPPFNPTTKYSSKGNDGMRLLPEKDGHCMAPYSNSNALPFKPTAKERGNDDGGIRLLLEKDRHCCTR